MKSTFLSKLVVPAFAGALLIGGLALSAPALACGDTSEAPNKAVPTDAAHVTLPVTGMSCGGCATAVHNALMQLDGVYAADVSYESGKAVIAYDAKKVSLDAISAAIDKAGYKAGKPQA
ncbi:MAG: heavy-metal-associated domain-containing protein [Myxococcota bacterium]